MDKYIFNRNLVFLRKTLGYSQQRLSNVLELNRSSLSSWEECRANPNIEVMVKIARFFGVTLDELCTENLNK